jgi:two-component system sensor histidine kinase/response regulator
MKILIIDDQPDLLDTLRDILEINGHEVLAAEDGVVGVKLAAQVPDFIFCDVSMPNLDGHGVLKAIKQMPGVCDVPFVFVTAMAERDQQRQGMTLGADDYITKPYTERDILEAIAARTKRQQSVREKIAELATHHQREIHAQWSHELFTPLNAILGSLDLLEMSGDDLSPAELKEIIGFIRDGARRQERLARKLLRYFNLEQLRQAGTPPAPATCAAADAVRAGVDRAAQETNQAGRVTVQAAPGVVALRNELLVDAIAEVVANALTFSPAGSAVTVNGAMREGGYRIEINDEGPGLTPEQRKSVGAFTQFDRQKREQQGLGLGLAMAQITAKLAGGRLALEPGSDNRGLRVIITLPLADAGNGPAS